jgi:uncharacterized membrane protein HdeD (DUF308 family)
MTDGLSETAGVPHPIGSFFPWWLLLILGFIALILGCFLLVYPVGTLFVIIWFLGFYWFFSGIVTLFGAFSSSTDRGMKILWGFLGIILGLLIIAYPLYSAFIVPFIFTVMVGILALIYGFVALYGAFTGKGWGIGILGILSIIFGILILAEPVLATIAVPFVFGILGIFFGFLAIASSFMLRPAQKGV